MTNLLIVALPTLHILISSISLCHLILWIKSTRCSVELLPILNQIHSTLSIGGLDANFVINFISYLNGGVKNELLFCRLWTSKRLEILYFKLLFHCIFERYTMILEKFALCGSFDMIRVLKNQKWRNIFV